MGLVNILLVVVAIVVVILIFNAIRVQLYSKQLKKGKSKYFEEHKEDKED